jgi:hypothetical protein
MKANELRIGNYINYKNIDDDLMQIEIDWLRLKWLSNESELFNTKYTK